MPTLAFSVVDALLVLGLGAAGFIVVALVCAGVLAMLHLVLPSADTGAAEIDGLLPPGQEDRATEDQADLDTGGNA